MPDCILYTQDDALSQRLTGFLRFQAPLRCAQRTDELEVLLRRPAPVLFLLDLRADHSRQILARAPREWPLAVVIVLGVPRSDPMREAEAQGVYAAEDLDVERRHFQALVARALDTIRLLQENRALRESSRDSERAARATVPPAPRIGMLPLQHFSRAVRHADNIQTLVEQIVEGMASAAMVLRAGIFFRHRGGDAYRLHFGLRCLEETRALAYAERDPLVQWMALHAHLISRANLDYIGRPEDRLLLQEALDAMGAEVIVPLQGQRPLAGWLFLGRRATGRPFDPADLEDLIVTADHVSIILENALLGEEIAVQKTLAETLLQSLPVGIVTVNLEGIVQWCNQAAAHLLDVAPDRVLNQPAGQLGSRLAELLWRTLHADAPAAPCEWIDGATQRLLSVTLRPLPGQGQLLGAMALISDLTRERRMAEQQRQLERSTFWNELAAAMSHEIHNPLVAISTFAQLLPDRYAEPEFREEFRTVVSREIERLRSMIDQLNQFAHPPTPEFQALDLRPVIEKSVAVVYQRSAHFRDIPVELTWEDNLPQLQGDSRSLTETFVHLITNAMEALVHTKNPKVLITAKRPAAEPESLIVVTVRDNGRGIPAEIRENIFSPFCTTKARGMGLGLAIVKRTILDHQGQILIDSDSQGTCIVLRLPVNHSAEMELPARALPATRAAESDKPAEPAGSQAVEP